MSAPSSGSEATSNTLFLAQIIGRLAGQLSILLQGKDKPIFAPYRDHGDVCIVVNAERAVFTGNKWEGKLYKWHTGNPSAAAFSTRQLM